MHTSASTCSAAACRAVIQCPLPITSAASPSCAQWPCGCAECCQHCSWWCKLASTSTVQSLQGVPAPLCFLWRHKSGQWVAASLQVLQPASFLQAILVHGYTYKRGFYHIESSASRHAVKSSCCACLPYCVMQFLHLVIRTLLLLTNPLSPHHA